MATHEISPADRIRELSSISEDAAAMLEAAGKAIHTLTNRPLISDDDDTAMGDGDKIVTNIDTRKEVFENNVKAYYDGLQAVIAKLRRQAYALEEAGIIEQEPPSFSSTAQSRQQQASPANATSQSTAASSDVERITNGGLGNLDVGYLNSRGNKVGVEKEAEMLQDVKKLLEDMKSR